MDKCDSNASEENEQRQQSRRRFFATLHAAQVAANLSDAEAMQLVDEVTKELRTKRRSQQ